MRRTTELLHWLASVILIFLVLKQEPSKMMTEATEHDEGMKDRAENTLKYGTEGKREQPGRGWLQDEQ